MMLATNKQLITQRCENVFFASSFIRSCSAFFFDDLFLGKHSTNRRRLPLTSQTHLTWPERSSEVKGSESWNFFSSLLFFLARLFFFLLFLMMNRATTKSKPRRTKRKDIKRDKRRKTKNISLRSEFVIANFPMVSWVASANYILVGRVSELRLSAGSHWRQPPTHPYYKANEKLFSVHFLKQ